MRHILLLGATVLLPGCGMYMQGQTQPRQSAPPPVREPKVMDEVFDLPQGNYHTYWVHTASGSFSYAIEVTKGLAVSVLVMDDANYTLYQGKKRFRYYTTPSTSNLVKGSRTLSGVPAGKYWIVIWVPAKKSDDTDVLVDLAAAILTQNPMPLLKNAKEGDKPISRVALRLVIQ